MNLYRLLCEVEDRRQEIWQLFLAGIKKYGVEVHPNYLAHMEDSILRKLPLEELPTPEAIEKDMQFNRQSQDRHRKEQQQQQQRDDRALRIGVDKFYVCDTIVQRAVCSSGNPGFDKKGMPAFVNDLTSVDKALKGYYAVHTGDAEAWLPILKRDGYCDERYAYIYAIDCEAVMDSDDPFYEMEDFHISDATNTPHSSIIFSKRQIIPAELITLEKRVTMSKVRTAPDPY